MGQTDISKVLLLALHHQHHWEVVRIAESQAQLCTQGSNFVGGNQQSVF